MGHHGSLHVGDTLERVTVEALLMELCAGYQLAAMAVGGKPLDAHDRPSYRDAYLKNGFREQMWLANYRRLLRSDPDLFATLKKDYPHRIDAAQVTPVTCAAACRGQEVEHASRRTG